MEWRPDGYQPMEKRQWKEQKTKVKRKFVIGLMVPMGEEGGVKQNTAASSSIAIFKP